MNRAIVIYGDREIGNAVADGMVRALPLSNGEMEVVLAENKRLNALNGVRSYGNIARYQEAIARLNARYIRKGMGMYTPQHGAVYGAILGVWACLWVSLMGWAEYFRAWNRG